LPLDANCEIPSISDVSMVPSFWMTVFFWMATPFVAFLKYHDYGILRGEVLLCLGVLAVVSAALSTIVRRWPASRPFLLAGLIALFLDVQFDDFWRARYLAWMFAILSVVLWRTRTYASQVLAAVGATMFVTTVLLPANGQRVPPGGNAVRPNGKLPFTLHIILDEHIGIEGLPPDADSQKLAAGMQAFFRRHDFMLFGGAYSRYFNTVRSLSHQFNFSAGSRERALYEKSDDDEFTWQLTQNDYLSMLERMGYAARVYQSNHVNVCSDPAPALACGTYNYTGLIALKTASLSIAEKAFAIASIVLTRTVPYQEFSKQYVSKRRGLLERGIALPAWNGLPQNAAPLIAAGTMASIRENLATARHGEYVLAHLLIPHSPYVYDWDCNVRPPWRWLGRSAPAGFANTREGRVARYRLYRAQMRCTYTKLEELLDAIPPDIKRDAIVIIQGDHGSRITTTESSMPPSRRLTSRDYVDGYSTLFAVRAPGLPPTYDTRMVPISCLFRTLVQSGYAKRTIFDACATPPTVVVADHRGSLKVARLPEFVQN